MGTSERSDRPRPTGEESEPLARDARYRTLFEHSLTGLAVHTVIVDEEGRPTDYSFDEVNPAFAELTGLSASGVLGRRATEVLPGAVEDGFVEDFGRVGVTGEPARFRRYSTGLGRHFDFSVFSLEPGRFVVSFMDVSDRVRSELAHARLARAIEQLGEIVVITDAEGVIEYVNPAFERITGYTREEAIGSSPRLLKSGRQTDEFYLDLWDTITRGETWSGTVVNRRKDGAFYRQEAVISPVRDAEGRIVNYVNVARDVTRVLELEEQLRQSQKLEAVGSLTGGLAHDLNNILSVITANADLLVQGLEEHDEGLLVAASDVHGAATRATKMIKQLLGFSRKATLDRQPLLLPALVTELSSMMSRLLPETIAVRISASARVPPVLADPIAVEQMVMNLVTNARDAMPGGGILEIEVGTGAKSAAELVGHPGARPGPWVWICVSDTGAGMDEHTRSHLFEPFFTTKAPGKGTGLGLAVTYGLMQQHEGFAEVSSSPGLGARVTLWFPAIAAEVADHTTAADARDLPLGAGQMLLVVEDEAPLRRTARRVLERHGYRVITADNGEEALELARLHGERLSLVISDIVMPGMGGGALLRALENEGYTLAVLFTSGYSETEGGAAHAVPSGHAYLPKPWSVASLLQAVHDALPTEEEGPASARRRRGGR
jgi:PAS domain S-box-containing protein